MPERRPWLATIGTTAALIGTLAGVGPQQHLHERRERYDAAPRTAHADQARGQEQRRGADTGWERIRIRTTSEQVRYEDGRSELDVVLDSMLITERVPPGVPFELRTGHVDDPRILELMREIDETLGGRIEWPNVYVTEALPAHLLGQYTTTTGSEGRTWEPEGRPAEAEGVDDRFGIKLDRELVEQELATGRVVDVSVRQLLVHELQHAVSFDNERSLLSAADRAGDRYDEPDNPTSEGRADMAMLIAAEMEQRRAAGGPRLNELPKEQRREVVREILTQYITPHEHAVGEQADRRLLAALRGGHYIHEEENLVWREVTDERTDAYVTGRDRYESPGNAFIPTSMDGRERYDELFTPLDELARRWSRERAVDLDAATAPAQGRAAGGRGKVTIGSEADAPARSPSPAAGASRRNATNEREQGEGRDAGAR